MLEPRQQLVEQHEEQLEDLQGGEHENEDEEELLHQMVALLFLDAGESS